MLARTLAEAPAAARFLLVLLATLRLSPATALADDPEKKKETPAEEDAAKAAKPLFPDAALEATVRRYVFAKRDGTEPLTADDVKTISTIEGRGRRIESLAGLEACVSLAMLDLAENAVADLSPIAGLTRLQWLDLSGNKIADLAPLAGLVKLQYLQLSGNAIADLAPLEKLAALRSLYLENNAVQDLRPVAGLVQLWSLYLKANKVEDIKPLAKLVKLSSLGLERNAIRDLAPLADMTQLRYILLDDNKVEDLSTLVAMAEKDFAGPKVMAPFWRIYLRRNPLSDAAKGAQAARLREIGGHIFLDGDEK